MAKFQKSQVDFEHPAKGPHHCSQCRHFEAPDACEIVAGTINRRDWCKKFASKSARRDAARDEHLNKISGSYKG